MSALVLGRETVAPLRVGLVGAGNIARVAHLPILAAAEGISVAGIVTRSVESASATLEAWPIEQAFRSLDDMLDRGALDALFVLSPRREHAGHVRRGLEAGLDVFCEKPLASSAADAWALAEAAEQRGRVLMVDFNRRFAPVYLEAKREMGGAPVQFLVAQKNRAGSEYRATLENAIHMVDLLRWYCGEAVDVVAHASGADEFEEDGLSALIRFQNGAVGSLVAARTAGEWSETLDLYGGNRSLHVISPDTLRSSRDGHSEVLDVQANAAGLADPPTSLGFGAAVAHFFDCVRNRATPKTNAAEAARTQDLLEAILRAAGLPLKDDPSRTWVSHAQ